MGGKWKGHKGGRGGGGGGGWGGGAYNDLKSVQGHACILGTSEGSRVKEGNKEILNLVSEAIEELYPDLDKSEDNIDNSLVGNTSTASSDHTLSDLLKEELEVLKKARVSSKQIFTSVNTKVKGVFCIKFLRKEICPVRIVCSIFDRVSADKAPVSRYICRLMPIMKSFYPDLEEVVETVRTMVHQKYGLPGEELPILGKRIASHDNSCEVNGDNPIVMPLNKQRKTEDTYEDRNEGDDELLSKGKDRVDEHEGYNVDGDTVLADETDIKTDKRTEKVKLKRKPAEFLPAKLPNTVKVPEYCVLFKRRNADTLVRDECLDSINNIMPEGATVNYKQPKVRKATFFNSRRLDAITF